MTSISGSCMPPPSPAESAQVITSLILCGGAGVRMGGLDKPLEVWQGKTLVGHVLSRLPQQSTVLISANRNLAQYGQLGWPVISDDTTDNGPLAGILAAIPHLKTTWLYVVPGDAPLLPTDLAPAMHAACVIHGASACCARTNRRQPLPLLVSAPALPQLSSYLQRGERSVGHWLTELNAIELSRPYDAAAFANFNTPADFNTPNVTN